MKSDWIYVTCFLRINSLEDRSYEVQTRLIGGVWPNSGKMLNKHEIKELKEGHFGNSVTCRIR